MLNKLFVKIAKYFQKQKVPPLLAHLESYLGETLGGWKNPGDEVWEFQAVQFQDKPLPDSLTICTLGMSNFCLQCGETRTHQEILFMTHKDFGYRSIPAILYDLGKEVIDSGHPLKCGNLIGPRGKLFPDTELEALFVYYPKLLPDSFHKLHLTNQVPCEIWWVIPITAREAKYVETQGWRAFAQLIEMSKTDWLNMQQASIVN